MSVNYFPRPGASSSVSIFDSTQLADLRRDASSGADAEQTQRKVAQQFEALFIQNILKQARQAQLGDGGLFDSQQVRMAQSLGDEQLALNLSQTGIGLGQALLAQMRGDQGLGPSASTPERSLSRRADLQSRMPNERPVHAESISALIDKLSHNKSLERVYASIKGAPEHIREFVDRMKNAAQLASKDTGLPEKLILSQAALESGWGQREIKHADGTTSHNLFGIKASPNWKGKVVDVMTTEYENGVPRKLTQRFRAYDSYAESFADYARLISKSPRYSEVVAAPDAASAAQRIQEAGYATDPSYAQKLISIMAYFDSGRR